MRRGYRVFHVPVWMLAALGLVSVGAIVALRTLKFSGFEAAQTVLAANTLVGLVWYAALTKDVATSAQAQAKASRRQARLLDRQMKSGTLPCVVIECISEGGGAHHYWLHNLGLGPALNVAHSTLSDDEPLTLLGSVPAAGRVRVPDTLYHQLEQERRHPMDRRRHVLFAESTDGQWMRSDNLIDSSDGHLSHRVRRAELTDVLKAAVETETIDEAIRRVYRELVRAESATALEPPDT